MTLNDDITEIPQGRCMAPRIVDDEVCPIMHAQGCEHIALAGTTDTLLATKALAGSSLQL